MKSTFKILIFTNVLVGIFFSCCKVHSKEEVVILYSATAQGNGYNWAATIAWLAESLKATLEEAKKIENNKNVDVKVMISSFAGGSSGSGVAMLLDAALNNPSIRALKWKYNLLSIDELSKLQILIQFVSRATDFTPSENISTFVRVAGEQIKSLALKGSKPITELIPLLESRPNKLWIHQMDGNVVLSDFGRMLLFVRNIDFNKLQVEVKNLPEFISLRKIASQDENALEFFSSLRYVYDIPRALSFEQVHNPRSYKDLSRIMKKIMEMLEDQMKKVIETEIKKKISTYADFFRRWGTTSLPNDLGLKMTNSLQQVLFEKPLPGFFTISLAKTYPRYQILKEDLQTNSKVDFSELRAVVFMTEETARVILNSKAYQHLVLQEEPFIKKYVIAVVDQRWAAMNPSIREPQLLNELSGRLASSDLRVRKIYDPIMDQYKKFVLQDLSDSKYTDFSAIFIGGFPYSSMTSYLQVIYLKACDEDLLSEKQIQYKSVHFTLKKDLESDDPGQFAIQQIRKTLNKFNQNEKNIFSFLTWDKYTLKYLNDFFYEKKGILIPVKLNWSISLLPAQLVDLGDILAQKSVNATRKSLEIIDFGDPKQNRFRAYEPF
ncbi:MAG: hypothetical protein L6Q37_03720 [Bdellovibrionaceae bacterium]|nr:hypothetical protein [Pseudobdellovibrionaceae bacterium]